MKTIYFALFALVLSGAGLRAAPQAERPVRMVDMPSELLSRFFGREITMKAAVIVPADMKPDEVLPVAYHVHGFGGSAEAARGRALDYLEKMREGIFPRMVYVFLDANCPMGHHVFADSVNNGPRGTALVKELIPAIETSTGGERAADQRFLTGHSSGGWSTLWLQVTWPEFFGGTWPTSPDSIDFRDFSGIDLQAVDNVYRDAEGEPYPLVRDSGKVLATFEQFAKREAEANPIGGQMASFDAVFSPRGDDGRPMPMFDRETGAIDPFVVRAWGRYDIGAILRAHDFAKDRLNEKIHLYMGEEDTFYLDGAVRLLVRDMKARNVEMDIVMVPGRDHMDLFDAHDELYPQGLLRTLYAAMAKTAAAGASRRGESSSRSRDAADPELDQLLLGLDDVLDDDPEVVSQTDNMAATDCGHDHSGDGHAGHDHTGHDHSSHDHTGHDHSSHDHSSHEHAVPAAESGGSPSRRRI